MPAPASSYAAVDHHIAKWRAEEEHLDARLREALADPESGRTRNLRILIRDVNRVATELAADALTFLDGHVPETWTLGAKSMNLGPPDFGQPHAAAVKLLVNDTHAELLAATSHMTDDLKQLVRGLGSVATRDKVVTGAPAKTAGRDLAQRMRDTGITAVTYKDGRHIKASTYAELVIRTKTAVAYNAGGLSQALAAGIRYMEGIDGHDCGLSRHDGEPKVNGKVFPLDVAAAYTISHPNCRRDWAPRSDVTSDDEAEVATSWRDPATTGDQVAWEKYLAGTGPAPTGKGVGREPRQPRAKVVTPRAPGQRAPRKASTTPRKRTTKKVAAEAPPAPTRHQYTEWADRSTMAAVNRQLREIMEADGKPFHVDLRGIPVENANTIAREVRDFAQALPAVRSKLRGVEVVGPKHPRMGGSNTLATADPVDGYLRFNRNQYDKVPNPDIERMRARQEELRERGGIATWHTSPGLRGTTAHELGHMLDYVARGDLGPRDFSTRALIAERSEALAAVLVKHGVMSPLNADVYADGQTRAKPTAHDKEALAKKLSTYGATNSYETVAESVAEYRTRGDAARPLARDVALETIRLATLRAK